MSDTKFKKDDLVVIGRKKDQYRIKQISPSGEGAVLVATVDAKPYVETYVNADQLKSAKATKQPATGQPPVTTFYTVTLTSDDGATREGREPIAATSEAEAIELARAANDDLVITAATATKVTS